MPAMLEPQKLIAAYERGILLYQDVIGELIRTAAHTPPPDLVSQIPADYLTGLRKEVAELIDVPPGRLIFVVGGTYVATPEFEAHQAERKRQFVAGLRLWHAYFAERDAAAGG